MQASKREEDERSVISAAPIYVLMVSHLEVGLERRLLSGRRNLRRKGHRHYGMQPRKDPSFDNHIGPALTSMLREPIA
jgi:hypothetical protein